MKKIKKFLLLLLVVPILFVLVSCKKDNATSNVPQNQTEIEEGGGNEPGDDSGSEEEPEIPPVVDLRYSVNFDYNLPGDYDDLVNDYSVNNVKTGIAVQLPEIREDLIGYFLGWYDGDTLVENTINSNTDRTINLVGHWDTDELVNRYYSSGLTFEVNGDKATITGYTSSSKKVFIPKYYNNGTNDYVVSAIADRAFESSNIEKLIINSAIYLDVGDEAFLNSKLKEADLFHFKSIGDSAFAGTDLENVVVYNLTTIGDSAFANCTKLKYFDCLNSALNISDNMFNGCILLEELFNTSNIASIGNYAFEGCKKLETIDFLGDNLLSIGDGAFKDCVGVTVAKIPASVSVIGTDIFENCENIEKLQLSRLYNVYNDGTDRLTTVFSCIASNIKEIELQGNVITRLYSRYFDGFTNLETFVMTNSILKVDDYTFYDCAKLENITFSENINPDEFSWRALQNTKFLEDLEEPLIFSNVLVYAPVGIDDDYEISSGITKIAASAFSAATNLRTITIPSSVTLIQENAFRYCANLETVNFAENSEITEIKAGTFNGCEKLSTINLTNLTNLSVIGNNAFKDVAVTNFVIPASVTTIASSAFSGADIVSFSISGTPDWYVARDGVLYYVDGADYTLVCYPKLKQGSLFVCPSDVVEIAGSAFRESQYLECIYFAQSSIEWESSTSAVGDTVYYNFFNTTNIIKILAEKEALEISPYNVDRYHLIDDSEYTYNAETGTITFDGGFAATYAYCFIKAYNSETSKYDVVYFELNLDTNTIKNGTQVVIESAF